MLIIYLPIYLFYKRFQFNFDFLYNISHFSLHILEFFVHILSILASITPAS